MFLRTFSVVGQNFSCREKAILQMCSYSSAISLDAWIFDLCRSFRIFLLHLIFVERVPIMKLCYKLKSSFTPTFSIILNWIIKMKALILHIVILNIELCCSFEISVMSNWPNIEIQANVSFVIQKEPPEVFYKKNVLKILQNSQKNSCSKVSFLIEKINLLKTKLLWILRNFYKHLPYSTPMDNCFCNSNFNITQSECVPLCTRICVL